MKDLLYDLKLIWRNFLAGWYTRRSPLEKVSSALVMVYERLSKMDREIYVAGGICPFQELRVLYCLNKISLELRYRVETALLTQMRPNRSIREFAIAWQAIPEDADMYDERYMSFRNHFISELADTMANNGN